MTIKQIKLIVYIDNTIIKKNVNMISYYRFESCHSKRYLVVWNNLQFTLKHICETLHISKLLLILLAYAIYTAQ